MKLKFKQATVKTLRSAKGDCQLERLAERGIFLPEKEGVSLQVVASKTMNADDASHISIALGSIYSSLDGKHHASMTQCLWDMVNRVRSGMKKLQPSGLEPGMRTIDGSQRVAGRAMSNGGDGTAVPMVGTCVIWCPRQDSNLQPSD